MRSAVGRLLIIHKLDLLENENTPLFEIFSLIQSQFLSLNALKNIAESVILISIIALRALFFTILLMSE
tara:strand:+ start:595 stop:801 length:207 start_codon:yes stop_codon:yes gene_type:complete